MKYEDLNEELSFKLCDELPKEQIEEVFKYEECDITCNFMGFVDTYYHLSELIPKDWTVIDIGAAYAPQCHFFRNHRKYIAIEPDAKMPMFHLYNTETYRVTCSEFIEKILPTLGIDLEECFAICNYVPNWYRDEPAEKVRNTFRNCYVFYPHSNKVNDIIHRNDVC